MNGAEEQESPGQWVAPIVDVTKFDIADLSAWQENNVIESIRHILAELDTSAGTISGWSSFLDDRTKTAKMKPSEDEEGSNDG